MASKWIYREGLRALFSVNLCALKTECADGFTTEVTEVHRGLRIYREGLRALFSVNLCALCG